ncbi:hypothetical protein CUS10_10585 [Enterococcus faecium]|nr:hypothetical protein D352_00122 [Enterococcus faecium LA4B-2]PQE61714.1 hypothetical protein CUS10_10585 [Enterococcus faecium]
MVNLNLFNSILGDCKDKNRTFESQLSNGLMYYIKPPFFFAKRMGNFSWTKLKKRGTQIAPHLKEICHNNFLRNRWEGSILQMQPVFLPPPP